MSEHTIGKFCSVAKKDTIITPKDIPGYITPKGQVLKEDGQRFNFIYTPISYDIKYDLNGGEMIYETKTSYTVEDEDFTPPDPVKEDNKFINWSPNKISKGSIGEVIFTANWKPNAVLLSGEKLNKALIELAGSKDSIMAIKQATKIPESYINISSTTNPILAYYSDASIFIYSNDDIYCNKDMSFAFAEFSMLKDISALNNFICLEGTNINSLFKNCSMLSDLTPVSEWANSGNFSDFTDAFKGTLAFECLRVPAWYKWSVKINYVSSSGVILKSIIEDKIPNEVIYPESFDGYKPKTTSIEITSSELEYTFIYDCIQYKISYVLNGGEINNQKKKYTIEDESYYPPEPVKAGYKFAGWNPPCINTGEFGNVSFIAKYTV